jgi:hypothetical protein
MAKSTQERLRDHLNEQPSADPELVGTAHDASEPFDPETGEVIAEPEAETLEGASDPMQIVAKITVSQCGGNPGEAKAKQSRVPVLAIYGKATEVKLVDDPTRKTPDGQTKQWEAVGGAFQAINLQNGQEYMSGVLYLPDAFQSMLLTLVKEQNAARARRGMSEFRGIDFAFQIDAIPASNPSGYSYVLRSLLPPRKADPLAALRARTVAEVAHIAPKALPAPAA